MSGRQTDACASSSGAQQLVAILTFVGIVEKTRKNMAQIRPQVVATHAVAPTCIERLREDTHPPE